MIKINNILDALFRMSNLESCSYKLLSLISEKLKPMTPCSDNGLNEKTCNIMIPGMKCVFDWDLRSTILKIIPKGLHQTNKCNKRTYWSQVVLVTKDESISYYSKQIFNSKLCIIVAIFRAPYWAPLKQIESKTPATNKHVLIEQCMNE